MLEVRISVGQMKRWFEIFTNRIYYVVDKISRLEDKVYKWDDSIIINDKYEILIGHRKYFGYQIYEWWT